MKAPVVTQNAVGNISRYKDLNPSSGVFRDMGTGFYGNQYRKWGYLLFVVVYVVFLLIFSQIPLSVDSGWDPNQLNLTHQEDPYQIVSYYEKNFNYQLDLSVPEFDTLEHNYTVQIVIDYSNTLFESNQIISSFSFQFELTSGYITHSLDGLHENAPSRADSIELQISAFTPEDSEENVLAYAWLFKPVPEYVTDYPGLIVLSMAAILLYPKYFEIFRKEQIRKELMRDIGKQSITIMDPRVELAGIGDKKAEKEIVRKQVSDEIDQIKERAAKDTEPGKKVA